MKTDHLASYKLLKEARESWDYVVIYKAIYFAEIRNRKNIGKQEGYINDYIEGCFWFEFIGHSFVDDE